MAIQSLLLRSTARGCRPFCARQQQRNTFTARSTCAALPARSAGLQSVQDECSISDSLTSSQQAVSSATSTSNNGLDSGASNLWIRSMLTTGTQVSGIAALVALGLALGADGALAASELDPVVLHHTGANPIAELAEENFWGNIVRYGRYFITVMLGTGYVMVRPLQGMLKNPVTAVLAISAVVALGIGMKVALQYMLGLDVYDYDPSTFKIAQEYDGI